MTYEIELLEAPYVERNGKPLMMTIVRKAGLENMPVLLEIHGGGWCGGERETGISVMARDRAKEGYLYLNMEYRLAPFQPYPAAVEDAQAALEWIVANAHLYGGDAQRLGLFGMSAGGHLATLMALKSGISTRCVVSWGGPMDYRNATDPEFTRGHASCVLAFLGACPHDRPDLYRDISPTCFLTASAPPMLIIHGECDEAVSWRHAESMREVAKEVGAPMEVVILAGAGHIDPGPHDPDAQTLWPHICHFMAGHLNPSGPIRPLSGKPFVTMQAR